MLGDKLSKNYFKQLSSYPAPYFPDLFYKNIANKKRC